MNTRTTTLAELDAEIESLTSRESVPSPTTGGHRSGPAWQSEDPAVRLAMLRARRSNMICASIESLEEAIDEFPFGHPGRSTYTVDLATLRARLRAL